MTRKKLIAIAVASILGAGATGSIAAYAGSSDKDEAQEVEAVLHSKTSLANAVQLVEAKGSGRAMAAGAEIENGKILYEISTSENGHLMEWRVDPATGAVHDVGKRDGDDGDPGPSAIVQGSSTSLASAIATAEQRLGGKALEAEYKNEDGKLWVEVEIIQPRGGVGKVVIDAATGQIRPNGPDNDQS